MTSGRFRTTPADAGRRLDQVLAERVPGLSRTRARAALAEGGVFVDGHRTKVAGRLVRDQQNIEVHWSAVARADAAAESPLGPFTILHRDADCVVVDKPSGVFSAPTPESDRNNLHRALEAQLGAPLFLVHRLDRPTSGAMVFACTRAMAAALSAQFQVHSIERHYRAILAQHWAGDVLDVEQPLEGKSAHTRFSRLETAPTATLVRAELFSGRTHQVRLHAEAFGHPVAGDSKYGRRLARGLARRAPRLSLHAERLGFDDLGGRRLTFEVPFPDDLNAYWAELRDAPPPQGW